MTQRIGNVVVIVPEPDETCALCGRLRECRTAGPNGERVCYDCALKNPDALEDYADKLFASRLVPGSHLHVELKPLEGILPPDAAVIVGVPWAERSRSPSHDSFREACGICGAGIALSPEDTPMIEAHPGIFKLCVVCFDKMRENSA
jgi:hypothetical protein